MIFVYKEVFPVYGLDRYFFRLKEPYIRENERKFISFSQLAYAPNGIIRSLFTDISGSPIQDVGARDIQGTVEVFGEFAEGLSDLDGFSRFILIYTFPKCTYCQLTVTAFPDISTHGIFATRAPCRTNTIGLSIVRLISKNDC